MATELPVTESVKFVESVYVQLGFLGLFIITLGVIIWFLYKQGGHWETRFNSQQEIHLKREETKSKSHQIEWEKLRDEHKADRKTWTETSEKRMDLIVDMMKENSRQFMESSKQFTALIEGTVKDNTKVLAEVSSELKQCHSQFH